MVEELYQQISRAVMEGEDEDEDEEAVLRVKEALEADMLPLHILQHGVMDGMNETGKRRKSNKSFLPDVILATDAFKAAMAAVTPHLSEGAHLAKGKRIVVGAVRGDVHDLGRYLIAADLSLISIEPAEFQPFDIWLRGQPQADVICKARDTQVS